MKRIINKFLITLSKKQIFQSFFKILRVIKIPLRFNKIFFFRGEFSFDFKISTNVKTKLRLISYGDCIENHFFWYGENCKWENSERFFWKLLCEKSNHVIDIGANTGIYSVIAKAMGCENVYAFEPLPSNQKLFEKNLQLNNFSIYFFPFAIGEKNEKITLFYGKDFEHNYSASLDKEFVSKMYNQVNQINIQVKSLDTIENIKKIDLMKLDIEGYEIQALKGMNENLNKNKPSLLIEILDENNFQKLLEILSDYEIYFIKTGKKLLPQNKNSFKPNGGNFLCLHSSNHIHLNKIKSYIIPYDEK